MDNLIDKVVNGCDKLNIPKKYKTAFIDMFKSLYKAANKDVFENIVIISQEDYDNLEDKGNKFYLIKKNE